MLSIIPAIAIACVVEWGVLSERPVPSLQDSLAVADSLRRADSKCAQMVAAYVFAFTTTSNPNDFARRSEVGGLLEQALRAFPNEPRVFLALAYLRLQQGMRSDAARLLGRTNSRARSSHPPLTPHERAVIAYLRGRLSRDVWRDWRSFGQLMGIARGQWYCEELGLEIAMNLQGGAGARVAAATEGILPSLVTFNLGCPELFERLMDLDFRSLADLKRDARSDLETWYRAALALEPTYWLPFRGLASEYAFEADWHALRDLSRRNTSAWPERFQPLAYLALAEYRLGRDSIARALFDEAIARMPPATRAIYTSPELVLSIVDARTFQTLTPRVREQMSQAYWRSREVIFLTAENERLLEHQARVTAADLVFGGPAMSTAGWNTSAGEVWIRFGRPAKIRDLAITNGRASFWSYGPDPDIVFTRFLTYAQFRIHEDAGPALQQLRERGATRFRPAALDSVVPLGGQVARFRSRGTAGTDLLLLAPYPTMASNQVVAGITVLDQDFAPVARWADTLEPGDGIAVTVADLSAGQYNLVIEVLDRTKRVLFQRRDTLTAQFAHSAFAMSDLLLARGVEGSDSARRRQHLRFRYLYDTQVEDLDTLTLYWEIYNPPVDDQGVAQYAVTIQVLDATRRPLLARVVRAVGEALFGGRPGTVIEFERTVAPDHDTVIDWVGLSADWESGTYEVVVTIRSLSGRGEVSARRAFVLQSP